MFQWVRILRFYGISTSRWLWETKGVWLRALLCLFLGLGTLFIEDSQSFDQRFLLRGAQSVDRQVVLIEIGVNEWSKFVGGDITGLRALKEFTPMGDQFFWSPKDLNSLIKTIQAGAPKAIGMSFFFQKQRKRALRSKQLFAPNVIWASRLSLENQPISPAFAKAYSSNIGIVDLPFDKDKVVRRFSQPFVSVPHFAIKLAKLSSHPNDDRQNLYQMPGIWKTINYRGPRGTFKSYSLSQIFNSKGSSLLKNKIIIVGARDMESHLVNTPVGVMSRAEVLANVVDNFLQDRWLINLQPWLQSLYLILILSVSIWILFSYPQSVAFVFLIWIGLGISALSLWIFDTYYIWIPLISPIAMIAFTYILFLGYQITQKDNLNWRLKQEQKYIYEVEQLKHNFVSLFSHDLKTPIAKIQAICDRLMASKNLAPEVQEGLLNLRKENTELNRYIQSILKVSRVESKDFQITKEANDINEIIFKVIEQLKPLARDKNQIIEPQLEPMFSVEFDSILVQEVILNLIENAIKYTPEGGNIVVSSKEIDNEIIFSVRDTGPGIGTEDQKKIFSKFYRVKAEEQSQKGSGIGLYLVKYFIELHGGRVFVESELNQGTKIGFTLPIIDESIAAQKETGV